MNAVNPARADESRDGVYAHGSRPAGAWQGSAGLGHEGNREFRYQLTVVDEQSFAMVRVSRKIAGNTFEIASSQPGIEVSWQVTGIRKDAWAEQNRIPNSVDKVGSERGKYLHPEAFGKPASEGMSAASAAPRAQPAGR
jgi:hypothetical protein